MKTEQGPGYIYCLIEHQSTSNKLIAFRMMRYAIAAMQNHLDAGYKTLPMVVPLLFYHGIENPIPIRCVGWIVSPIPNWQGNFMPPHFR